MKPPTVLSKSKFKKQLNKQFYCGRAQVNPNPSRNPTYSVRGRI